MSATIMSLAAGEHVADLRRAAQRRRVLEVVEGERREPSIELRQVDAQQSEDVRRLAALDDAPELEGGVLLAVIDGEPIAAMSLHDGRVVANPFVRTSEAVELLRVRGTYLSGTRARRRVRFFPRLKLA